MGKLRGPTPICPKCGSVGSHVRPEGRSCDHCGYVGRDGSFFGHIPGRDTTPRPRLVAHDEEARSGAVPFDIVPVDEFFEQLA